MHWSLETQRVAVSGGPGPTGQASNLEFLTKYQYSIGNSDGGGGGERGTADMERSSGRSEGRKEGRSNTNQLLRPSVRPFVPEIVNTENIAVLERGAPRGREKREGKKRRRIWFVREKMDLPNVNTIFIARVGRSVGPDRSVASGRSPVSIDRPSIEFQ